MIMGFTLKKKKWGGNTWNWLKFTKPCVQSETILGSAFIRVFEMKCVSLCVTATFKNRSKQRVFPLFQLLVNIVTTQSNNGSTLCEAPWSVTQSVRFYFACLFKVIAGTFRLFHSKQVNQISSPPDEAADDSERLPTGAKGGLLM